MAINADTLLDRMYLKRQSAKWRLIAVVSILAFAFFLVEGKSPNSPIEKDFIARLNLTGVIEDDQDLYDLIDEVSDNGKAKAVIVWLDTPGGSAVAGEEIYLRLRKLAERKPVVAVMRSVAASAGYMAALGTDYIIAREGTITGSIGVLIESAEVTELAKKIGIEPVVIKSAPLKGSPSPLEKLTPESAAVVQTMIDDFYLHFVDMVAERRQIPREKALSLADGRIFGGKRAMDNRLIDALGGEDEAVAWLEEKRNIQGNLPVKNVESDPDLPFLEKLANGLDGKIFNSRISTLDGLAAIWHPTLH